jgi:hippurate hydrolase
MLGLLLMLSTLAPAGPVDAATSAARAEYEWFHAHPELSKQEVETAAHLADALRKLGLEVHEGIGGTGIVGVLKGNGPGPVVLYRADMDGLPVTERTGVGYASENPGVMHACGHDVHMATAIGAMSVLAATRDAWSGTVLFVGQPAEELGAGARAMVKDRAFKALLKKHGKPKVALALHDAADLPAGDVSIIEGAHHANVDGVDIVVHGKGGHGARPHETIDPIVIGAEIVMALQTIVSRRIRPDEKAVVTVGKFDAGTKRNIIPPTATLSLTVRSYGPKTRKVLMEEIERVAVQVAKAHRAPRDPEIHTTPGLPSCENDPAWTRDVRAAFAAELGAEHVQRHEPSLGGEDFGIFGEALGIPAIMWKLGGVEAGAWKRHAGDGTLPGLHSDRWAPDPNPTLRTGIRTAVAAIRLALTR